jgi:hypothetical protein
VRPENPGCILSGGSHITQIGSLRSRSYFSLSPYPSSIKRSLPTNATRTRSFVIRLKYFSSCFTVLHAESSTAGMSAV